MAPQSIKVDECCVDMTLMDALPGLVAMMVFLDKRSEKKEEKARMIKRKK